MIKKPSVSVIIPFYNESRYLRQCVDSLLTQSYRNLEIILIDDGSSDRSSQSVRDLKIKILKQKHQGPGVARNKGAKIAQGKILCFLDADMVYDKFYIENLIKPILQGKTIGTFNVEYVGNSQNIWSTCWSINSDLNSGQRHKFLENNRMGIYRAIQKNEFEKAGGFDPEYGYQDDKTLYSKLKKLSILARGAISYHNNPESLREVFYSSRWIARSGYFQKDLISFFRFSFLNSIRISLIKITRGAPLRFIFFKIIYDFGIFCGIFLSGKKVIK